MLLTVRVSDWELEESGRILRAGKQERFWLTFEEAGGGRSATELVNMVRGVAVPLHAWPGGEYGRHPIRIDVDGGALYWDAPERIAGPMEAAGTVSVNNVDAPDGFPATLGVLRRLRMMWHDVVIGPQGVWRSTGEATRYEDVTSTYFPVRQPTAFDPEVEAELRRSTREAYHREVAAGRLNPGESFTVGMKVPASRRGIPEGTSETRWTGVLIDFDTTAPIGS
jgi:hypothetical protein